MSKDPAFLFYPGDYLRDTQNLSEKSQVAYDRIMCEHMRNICISQQQLKFFTKRLSEDEIDELMMVIEKIEGGYCIQWVSESVTSRRLYSESRRKNKQGKTKNISKTYDNHMEDENENTTITTNKIEPDFDFGFIDDRFTACFFEWIKFRKEIKDPILHQAVLEKCYKELVSLSKNNSDLAQKIVTQSMNKGWKHLYELKIETNNRQTTGMQGLL